jgi:hypothetical protein
VSIRIDKGVPMPQHMGRRRKYPWTEMEVGDSFHAGETRKEAERVRSSASYFVKRNPALKMKFAVCRTDDGTEFRCWRIE